MAKQTVLKQERIIEAIRRDLPEDQAVVFVQSSGYAMTPTAYRRHLKRMGGRENVERLIRSGKSNREIMEFLFPEANLTELPLQPPVQGQLFVDLTVAGPTEPEPPDSPVYDTVKLTLHLPADVYEALRLAARAEGKTQNRLITELLTTALSQGPRFPEDNSRT